MLLLLGPLLLIIGVVYEMHTSRVAVLPSMLFRSRTEGKSPLHVNPHDANRKYSGDSYRLIFSQHRVHRRNLLSGVVLPGTRDSPESVAWG